MLVLTRGNGERIRVGDDIEITVLKVKGGKVCLGIDAPKEVSIARAELLFSTSSSAPSLDCAESPSQLLGAN